MQLVECDCGRESEGEGLATVVYQQLEGGWSRHLYQYIIYPLLRCSFDPSPLVCWVSRGCESWLNELSVEPEELTHCTVRTRFDRRVRPHRHTDDPLPVQCDEQWLFLPSLLFSFVVGLVSSLVVPTLVELTHRPAEWSQAGPKLFSLSSSFDHYLDHTHIHTLTHRRVRGSKRSLTLPTSEGYGDQANHKRRHDIAMALIRYRCWYGWMKENLVDTNPPSVAITAIEEQ